MGSIIDRCDTSIYAPLNSSTLQEKHLEQEKRRSYDTSLPLSTPDVIHNLTLQYGESAPSIEKPNDTLDLQAVQARFESIKLLQPLVMKNQPYIMLMQRKYSRPQARIIAV